MIPNDILCIDPGKRTGFARFIDGKATEMGALVDDCLWPWLREQAPDIFVVENFRIRPYGGRRVSKMWSSPVALQIIGAVKARADEVKAFLHLQEPSVLPVGCGFMGIPYTKGKHLPDELSAMAHGAYYLVKTAGMNPKELREKQTINGVQDT